MQYFDPWVKRTRVEHAREEDLDFIPDWHGKRLLALGEIGAARVGLSGPTAPGLMEDLDPGPRRPRPLPRAQGGGQGRQRPHDQLDDRALPDARVGRSSCSPTCPRTRRSPSSSSHLMHVCRLDEEDPVAAWRERADFLVATAERLTERDFDALHYEGPGTDLTIGLLQSARWAAARFERADGLEHMPNIPTEEVFTSPDPARVDGTVASTKPLVLMDGTVVRNLKRALRGRPRGADRRRLRRRDDAHDLRARRGRGAARRDRARRPRGPHRRSSTPSSTTRCSTRTPRATSRSARASRSCSAGANGDGGEVNSSEIHIDFMIGSNELAVTGITADGERVPVLRDGSWQI